MTASGDAVHESVGGGPARRGGAPLVVTLLAFVAYLVTGVAWALSSPVGSSPDEDYHLTSIWCPHPVASSGCEVVNEDPLTVLVPEKVAEASSTYWTRPDVTGAAAEALSETELVPSSRVDQGDYPGPFYRAMNLLVGASVTASVLTMRVVNVVLPLLLLGALAVVGRPEDRRHIAYTAAATCVPLGLFLWASVNPSSWAYSGTLVAWAGLLTAYAAPRGLRLWVASAVAILGAIMAAVARGDSGIYLALAALGSVWLFWPHLMRDRARLALPVVVLVLAVWSFLSAGQAGTATLAADLPDDWPSLTLTNVLGIPRLPLGIYGLDPQLGLGWADTPMPALVPVGGIAVLFILVAVGLESLDWRRALGWAGIATIFFALPLYMLVKDMVAIGTFVQPRYFLPLAVLVVGTTVLRRDPTRVLALRRGQKVVVVGVLSVAQAVALFTNLSRYTTGLRGAWLLDQPVGWWWPGAPVGPWAVWGFGSVAFLVALTASVGLVGRDAPETSAELVTQLNAPQP